MNHAAKQGGLAPLCIFVGLEDSTGHVIDDLLCEPYLQERGWRLQTRPWTVPSDWSEAELVVLRSCYDYWLKPVQFAQFLQAREEEGCLILNPPRLVRWNSNKRYLQTLTELGIATIATLILDQNTPAEALPSFLAQHSAAPEFVVKPLIGAGGFEMLRLSRSETSQYHWRSEVMLQPFLPRILEGELSAIFFNGEPSHAVIKKAQTGEYRVQDTHGGTTQAVHWKDYPTLLEHAHRVAQAMHSLGLPLPAYARFDFVAGDKPGELLLMEVEAIEPTLFLAHDDQAPRRFVEALLSYVSKSKKDH